MRLAATQRALREAATVAATTPRVAVRYSSSDPSTSAAAPPSSELPPTPSTSAAAASPVAEPTEELSNDDTKAASTSFASPGKGKGFRAWLAGDGAQYRDGRKGSTNWIGDTPFPMNPSFHPRPPLADTLKTQIYNAYTHNITRSGTPRPTDSLVVRAVSLKFGVAMDRVRAVVRLKELEREWVKQGKTLQTELVKGMESHLGVREPTGAWKGSEAPELARQARARSKTVYEMVDVESGDSPVFLPLVARAAELPTSSITSSPSESTTTTLKAPRRPKDKVVPASRPGRAATVFTDLSGTPQGEKLASTKSPKTRKGNRRAAEEHES